MSTFWLLLDFLQSLFINPGFVGCLAQSFGTIPISLLEHPSPTTLLQSAPKYILNVGGWGGFGSAGKSTFGDIGSNFTGTGKFGLFTSFAFKFKSALFTTFGFIAAFNSKSTIGSGTGIVLAIP